MGWIVPYPSSVAVLEFLFRVRPELEFAQYPFLQVNDAPDVFIRKMRLIYYKKGNIRVCCKY